VAVYGFAETAGPVEVSVQGAAGSHGGTAEQVSFKVAATVSPWVDTSGCNATACIDPKTPLPPDHGAFVFVALLPPQPAAGGSFSVTASQSPGGGPNATISLHEITYGDVYYCSGQSNMALETFYTYSADSLKEEIAGGKYGQLRHFMFGSMGNHFEALAPQWVVSPPASRR